jgi:DNA invertase Pin-like site-specific DNA recombinase
MSSWYPSGVRAAIYVRQSLDRSGEGLAVGRQEAECRELAARNRWDVTKVYSDNDKSATSGRRERWDMLLADLRAGQYDVLICWHTDRLYRRLRDLVDLVEIAEKRALRIASVKAADIDLSTPAGRMLAGMLGHASRYEIEQKGARQVAANQAAAKRGVVRWSRRPYGYDLKDGKVVIVPAEARELRKAAKKILAGATAQSVVADMNARGVRTSLGGQWGITGLRRLLINPRHAGRAVSGGHDYGRGQWPAIFDPDTADQLVTVLTDPRRRTAPANLNIKYLLTGIAVCGKCGKAMYACPAENPRRMIYRCLAGMHLARGLEAVDEVVQAVVIARLSQPDAVRLLLPDVDVDALRARVTELRDRRDGLAGLLADGLLSTSAVRDQATKLTAAISELEREMMSAVGDGPLAEIVNAPDVSQIWEGLPLTAKRGVIETLMTVTILPIGKGVRFAPDQVQIDWRT